ncbi:hypothetical protein TNCV_4052191 [Trichonephila clavipes]|nr:hypothetical protein TNCV_4052191 [Trichonephila clavipes]
MSTEFVLMDDNVRFHQHIQKFKVGNMICLAGYSFGSVLVFEMALQAEKQPHQHPEVQNIFFLDASPDRLTNKSVNEHFHERFLCLDNEYILGGDQGYTPEIMDVILTTSRDQDLEGNEDDIEELIMGHEDELTTELQEILNEENQKTQRSVSPTEEEEDERGPMPTSAI